MVSRGRGVESGATLWNMHFSYPVDPWNGSWDPFLIAGFPFKNESLEAILLRRGKKKNAAKKTEKYKHIENKEQIWKHIETYALFYVYSYILLVYCHILLYQALISSSWSYKNWQKRFFYEAAPESSPRPLETTIRREISRSTRWSTSEKLKSP